MSDKPTLKLVRCHRGLADVQLASMIARKDGPFKRITEGPLAGCFRFDRAHARARARGGHSRGVFKLGIDYVLEFVVCIRVRL